jgi:DNA-binding XRE family transcriptional regulator
MRAKADHPIRMVFAHCELYQNNEVAIRQALRLRATRPFVDPMIVEPDGGIVWSPPDLLREFDSRRHLTRSNSKWLDSHLAKAKLKPNNSDGRLGGEGVVAVALSQYEVKGHIDYPDVREWSWPVSQLPQVHETDTMDFWDLKKWRRKLKYSQSETADKLGVTRGAIQNWESERSRIPPALELACQEITRRWKQRPSFGPVFLIYTDEPMWPDIDCPSCISCVCCELYPNNESAIRRVRHLRRNQQFFNPTIMEENGVTIWTAGELPVE